MKICNRSGFAPFETLQREKEMGKEKREKERGNGNLGEDYIR